MWMQWLQQPFLLVFSMVMQRWRMVSMVVTPHTLFSEQEQRSFPSQNPSPTRPQPQSTVRWPRLLTQYAVSRIKASVRHLCRYYNSEQLINFACEKRMNWPVAVNRGFVVFLLGMTTTYIFFLNNNVSESFRFLFIHLFPFM